MCSRLLTFKRKSHVWLIFWRFSLIFFSILFWYFHTSYLLICECVCVSVCVCVWDHLSWLFESIRWQCVSSSGGDLSVNPMGHWGRTGGAALLSSGRQLPGGARWSTKKSEMKIQAPPPLPVVITPPLVHTEDHLSILHPPPPHLKSPFALWILNMTTFNLNWRSTQFYNPQKLSIWIQGSFSSFLKSWLVVSAPPFVQNGTIYRGRKANFQVISTPRVTTSALPPFSS